MWMWFVIFVVTLLALVAAVVYLVAKVGEFGGIRKLSADGKWKRRGISLAVIVAGFTVLTMAMSFVNATVVFLIVTGFFLLLGGIGRIARAVRKSGDDGKSGDAGKFENVRKPGNDGEFGDPGESRELRNGSFQPRVNWRGWLALGVSAMYLSIAAFLCFHVWQTDYVLKTDKQVGQIRAALIADSHLGTTFDGEGFAKHMKTIEAQHPDLLLIAGDFVDDSSNKADMLRACEALGELDLPYGVWFAWGNHDEGYGLGRDFTGEDLEEALTAAGVGILEDEAVLLDDRFYVVGRLDRSMAESGRQDRSMEAGGNQNFSAAGSGRKSMDELLNGLDRDKYIIVMDHEPNDYEQEAASDADLVVSGHTHGGQLISVMLIDKLFHINDRSYGYEERQGTKFIVTSGISDWELLFKTGTKSEYVMITIDGEE